MRSLILLLVLVAFVLGAGCGTPPAPSDAGGELPKGRKKVIDE